MTEGGKAKSGGAKGQGGGVTLRKLQAFSAVARARSMTEAAKQLGVAQPSLSQMLTGLEREIGGELFERRSSRLTLTDAGAALLRKAENVIQSFAEFERLAEETSGEPRRLLRVAGIPSAMRMLTPPALRALRDEGGALEADCHENAPAEVVELLYARRADVGILSLGSVAAASVGAAFAAEPLMRDPMVLAAPDFLDLDKLDPARPSEVEPQAWAALNSVVQIELGTQNSARVNDWLAQALPSSRVAARARGYEAALPLVAAGLGVAVVPLLAAAASRQTGLRLYDLRLRPRELAAIAPRTHLRLPLYESFLAELRRAAANWEPPPTSPTPKFLDVV